MGTQGKNVKGQLYKNMLLVRQMSLSLAMITRDELNLMWPFSGWNWISQPSMSRSTKQAHLNQSKARGLTQGQQCLD